MENISQRIIIVLLLCVAAALGLDSACAGSLTLADLKRQFEQPEQAVDFAEAKITIDRLIDPSTDVAQIRKELDQLTQAVHSRITIGLTHRGQMDMLLDTLYQPGAWNGNRPFSYDLSDPFGKNRRNKLLVTYLQTRKGNCISMPILVAIIGQRLGLIVTLAMAPEHMLVKFVDDDGNWWNVEATAGGYKWDSSYERDLNISALAIQNEIYLRPLSPRESVGAMASTLMEDIAAKRNGDDLMTVADMILAANPKDTVAMIQKANAYYLQLHERYKSKYPNPADIPANLQADFQMLSRENLVWFDKVEALGWVPPTEERKAKYLRSIETEKERRRQQ
jgi:regulator of sirC expression with transglutaminase-like and TPR domain